MSILAHGWPKIYSATGTPKRQLPPEYLGANTSKYNSIADSLISLGSGSASINNIQMAPAGVVSFIHPLAGNEGAIGHDLMRDPNRRGASVAAPSLGHRLALRHLPFFALTSADHYVHKFPLPSSSLG
jgi:hypothetical protein